MKNDKSYLYLGLGLCFMSIMIFVLVSGYVQRQGDLSAEQTARFNQSAQRMEVVIQNSIAQQLSALYAMRDGYAVSEQNISRARFTLLASGILARTRGVQALEWIPRVSRSERSGYESRAQNEGLPDFMIKEQDDNGNMVRAKESDEYFPVYFVEPLAGNEKAVGFNLAANPERKSALKKALETGRLVASSRIKLVQETGNQNGVLLFLAQIRSENTEAEQAGSNLLLGVFRIKDMVTSAFPNDFHPDLNVHIYDVNDSKDPSPLVVLSNHHEEGEVHTLASLAGQSDHVISRDLMVADRVWRLVITPVTPIEVFAAEREIWLMAMLIMSILLAMGVYVIRRADDLRKASAFGKVHHEARMTLHSILDNTIDGIITFDEAGEIKTCNQSIRKILGYSAEELVGSNVSMITPEFKIAEYIKRSISPNGVDEFKGIDCEVDGITLDREIIPLRLGVSDVTINDELLYIGIMQDITQKKRSEEMKDSFISTVNHELRTPLTSILGGVELLSKLYGAQLPEKAQELLAIVEGNTRRITTIVNDILDIQKIEAGEIEFNLEPVDLSSLVNMAITENLIYAKKYNVRPVVSELVENITVLADPTRLIQVLTNLLSNAVKFSPKGGEVMISSMFDEQRQVIRVEVADQGPGIPEKFKEKLFQRFSQADNIMTRKASGTGLGLSISKAIIEKLGGTIGVDSEEGHGAVFYFELEVHSSAATTTGTA
ncbi:CHASE domain-containing protein [Endozoicomonas sp.]|uniref:CHASE domain-containing protein n=1 Tax=Endozoicomonas sp. TaxID=1892382 RepID=UPI00383B24C8